MAATAGAARERHAAELTMSEFRNLRRRMNPVFRLNTELGKTNGARRQVLLAHDTRPSAPALVAAAAAGVEAAGCASVHCGGNPLPAALSSHTVVHAETRQT